MYELVVDGDRQCLTHERAGLVRPVLEQQRLGIQSLREHSRQPEGLRDPESELHPLHRRFVVALEQVDARRFGRERRNVLVRLLSSENLERRVEHLDRLRAPAEHPQGEAETCCRTCGVMRSLGVLVERARLAEPRLGEVGRIARDGGLSGTLQQLGAFHVARCELGRAVESTSGVFHRCERRGSFGCTAQPVARLRFDDGGIVGTRFGGVCVEVVRRDHLRDLIRVDPCLSLEEAGGGEVAGLPVAAGERLVRDALDERLQEAVLAALRRARVGLEREQLLPHERGEDRLEVGLCASRDGRQPAPCERLAEDGSVLECAPFQRAEPVQARGDQRVERLGYLERVDRAAHAEAVAVALQQPAIEQHPHRLDGVERDAIRAVADRCP